MKKKIFSIPAILAWLAVVFMLQGCYYIPPEGYKAEHHSYEAALAYARSIDPDATVLKNHTDLEEQYSLSYREWDAVIYGIDCHVGSAARRVWNQGIGAGEFARVYYALDTDYDYYLLLHLLAEKQLPWQLDENTAINRYQWNDILSVHIIASDDSPISDEELNSIWENAQEIHKEYTAHPVRKTVHFSILDPNNFIYNPEKNLYTITGIHEFTEEEKEDYFTRYHAYWQKNRESSADTTIPDTTAPETEPPQTDAPVIDVAEIALRIHDVSFHAGETVAPQATVSPADAADPSLLWTTSDPAVAVVDENGVITGVAQGTCTITAASAQNPAVTDTVTVTVAGEDECTYIDGILIANKTYPLPKSYAPGMDQEAFAHICTMFSDAKAAGLTLWVKSSYRSYYDQRYIYNGYVARDGQEAADRYSARAGHSEHQSGLAFDLNELTFAFGESPEGIWLAENCHKYGFILRYPKDKEDITGYVYEPWHVRYIGKEKAAAIHESGLCLEEYLGITSVYGD